jgi:hypothetical protein
MFSIYFIFLSIFISHEIFSSKKSKNLKISENSIPLLRNKISFQRHTTNSILYKFTVHKFQKILRNYSLVLVYGVPKNQSCA